MVSSGAISVSMSMTGIPASIILLTGAVKVPMPNAWMATKSHFWIGHVVDRGALLDRVELAVEPGDVDVEQLAPVFRRLLALGAPGRLQSGVGERGLERLLRTARGLGERLGDHWVDAQSSEQSRGAGACGRRLEQLAAIRRNI